MADKNNSLDDIVKCTISIAEPAVTSDSFGNVLIIAEPATTPKGTIGDVISITSADDLTKYGYLTTENAYLAATVAFSQSPQPDKVYFAVKKSDEDVTATLARVIAANNEWYFATLAYTPAEGELLKIATWIEAQEKQFGFIYTDVAKFPLTSLDWSRTSAFYVNDPKATDQTKAASGNLFFPTGLAAEMLTYHPGQETWALKKVATANPGNLTSTEKDTVDAVPATYYARYAGKNITSAHGGKVLSGEWIDVIRFRDWLKNEIQTKVFNVLTKNPKLPYTDAGITAVEGAVKEALVEGQKYGGISPTEYDSDGNEIPGFTISVPKSAEIDSSVKESRVLHDVVWTAKLAGAIQAVQITGTLTY